MSIFFGSKAWEDFAGKEEQLMDLLRRGTES